MLVSARSNIMQSLEESSLISNELTYKQDDEDTSRGGLGGATLALQSVQWSFPLEITFYSILALKSKGGDNGFIVNMVYL